MKKKLTIGIILLLFSAIVLMFSVFYRAQSPIQKAQEEAVAAAEEAADLKEIEDFYWYNGSETYFSVAGLTQENELVYVLVKQNGGETAVYSAEEIVTEEEAKSITQADKQPKEILEARIGMEEEAPVWEVVYLNDQNKVNYYVISAETGEWSEEMTNL